MQCRSALHRSWGLVVRSQPILTIVLTQCSGKRSPQPDIELLNRGSGIHVGASTYGAELLN